MMYVYVSEYNNNIYTHTGEDRFLLETLYIFIYEF